MVSESEIVTRLQEFLRTSDLTTTTTTAVRRKLEEDFGIDLSDRKAFIREQVDLFLEEHFGNDDAFDEEHEPQEGEEESKASNTICQEEEEDDDNDDDDDEDGCSKGKSTRKRGSNKKTKVVKRKGGGFTKLCSLSPKLQILTGVPQLARTEVVKQLWAYIKENELQDPSNRRKIVCDEKLHALFQVKSIDMFQMNKALTKHIWPLESADGECGHENDDKEEHQKAKVKEEDVYIKEEDDEEKEDKNKASNLNDKEEEEIIKGSNSKDEHNEENIEASNLKGDEEEENSITSNSKADDEEENSKASNSKGEAEGREEDEEETSKGKGSRKKRPTKQNQEVKKKGGGFTKLCSLSPQLQNFTGVPVMARTQVVKFMWVYIKEKKLQDPSNGRKILCDEALHGLFGVNSIDMFQMNKALTKHIWPLEPDDGSPVKSATEKEKKQKQEGKEGAPVESSTRKEKKRKRKIEEDADEEIIKEKKTKGGTSGFLVPLQLSDALAEFFGTGDTTLSRAEVVKRIWEYIKQNNLQDPSDKRQIICDEKLKELFAVDSFHGFTVSRLLTTHLTKIEQAFMESNLYAYKEGNPRLEVVNELIRGQHPHLKGYYKNKNERVVCVKNMTSEDVLHHATRLRNALGRKAVKLKTRHVTKHPSVQGTWTTGIQFS